MKLHWDWDDIKGGATLIDEEACALVRELWAKARAERLKDEQAAAPTTQVDGTVPSFSGTDHQVTPTAPESDA